MQNMQNIGFKIPYAKYALSTLLMESISEYTNICVITISGPRA